MVVLAIGACCDGRICANGRRVAAATTSVTAPRRSAGAKFGRQALLEHPALFRAYTEARQRRGGASYVATREGRRWRAENAAHGFTAHFAADGVTFDAGDARFELSFAGLGRAQGTLALPRVHSVHERGHVITYERGALTEWYVNGPLGLEQGFELRQRPAGDGELVLAMNVRGDVATRLADGDQRVVIEAGSHEPFIYRDLVVYDADRRRLPARMSVEGRRIAVRFDDRGARYPVVVDPMFAELEATLVASDAAGGDVGGGAVSISGDTAAIGAVGDDDAGPDTGAACVFVRTGATWVEQAKLVASDGNAADQFGWSVAVLGDTVVVGAPPNYDSNKPGAAYVFVRSGSIWTEQAVLRGAYYGNSVAVSGDIWPQKKCSPAPLLSAPSSPKSVLSRLGGSVTSSANAALCAARWASRAPTKIALARRVVT